MPFHTVVLTFGYVESASTATLWMSPEEITFETAKEAVESLANEFYVKYVSEGRTGPQDLNPCCSKGISKKHKFCRECGKSLRGSEFDEDTYRDFLYDIFHSDNDSYGNDARYKGDYETPDNACWGVTDIGNAISNPEGIVFINEMGEKILTQALPPSITGMTEDARRDWLDWLKKSSPTT